MLKEIQTYKAWEVERVHRIRLSLHEIDILRHALRTDVKADGLYKVLYNRLSQMRNKIIDEHFS